MAAFRWLYGQPYVLLLFTALFWGGNAVAGKIAVGHISPLTLTCLRWLLAMAIVLPFAWPHLRRDWAAIRPRLPLLILLGAVGFTLFNNLMYTALNYTSAVNVAIVQAAMPLMVFLMNFAFYRIATTPVQLGGFALTFIGVAIIAGRGEWQVIAELAFNLGDVIMLSAMLCYGFYTVMLRNKPQMHWLSFIAVLGTSALVTSIFAALWEWHAGHGIWPDATGWGTVLYTAIFPAILSQVFWMRGIELIGSNRAGLFINIVPIFGSLLAVALLGEAFRSWHAIALALILGGVWVSQRQPAATGSRAG